MSTSGAIAGQAFNFNYSFVSSADPTLFHTTVLATTDITIYQRTGGSTSSAGNPVTAPTVSGNVHTISLTAGEMSGDEVVLDISSTGMVSEVISISLEPAQSDIREVTGTPVTNVNDFKATGFSTLVATDIVSDGNPITAVSGTVSNVATTATVTDKAGYTISGTKTTLDALNDVAATDIVSAGPITTLAGAVVNVDTVDNCTTNSDMLTVSSIVNGVWSEAQSGYVTAGTFGYYLDDLVSTSGGGGGGTDWSATEKNQIRYRLGVDGTTAVPAATPDLSTFDASTDTVTTDTASRDASKADVSGLATAANLAIVDTNVDAILVDTGTTIPAQVSGVEAKVDIVDANVDAVLADTGTDGVAISTAQAQAIADEILKRSVGNVEGATLDEHSLATVVLAILESQRVGSTWTIYRTDGATTQATKTLTLDASAQPVTRVQ